MNRRTVHALVLCAVAILSTCLALAAPEVRLRDDNALWDEEKMALNLKDADVRQVLTLVFQIAEEPVMIDPCVRGSVSLKFENVGLRDALTSIARMGDFTVRPRREGYFVGCVNRAADRTADGQIIVFRLTNLGDGSVVAQPKLLVAYDSLAEIEIGSLAAPDLDDVGEFFAGGLRPHVRFKVYLDHDEDGITPDRLRGVMELAVRDTSASQPALRMAAQTFDVELPPGTAARAVVTLEVAGDSYELTATRPAPQPPG